MKRTLRLFLILALATVAGLGMACRSPVPDPAADRVAEDTIVVAAGVDMRGVNELVTDATQIHTAIHYFALFRTLLDERPDFQDGPPTFGPELAESHEFSADRRTLTFHLRGDAVWSDGEPVTAQDVRFTWQAHISPEVAWPLADFKKHIRDVEVVDPQTVRFHFERVYAAQLLDANLGVILPAHAWGELPFAEWRAGADWFLEHLVVSGPFRLESWEPQQRIVLRRNERFYNSELPAAERIVFRIVPDRSAQMALLRSGDALMMEWARPGDVAALEADPEIRVESFSQRGFHALVWNHARPPFDQLEVRRALTMAIDRQALVEGAYMGYAAVAASPYMSDLWVHKDDLEPLPYDPDGAAALLAEAGWSDHDGDGVLDKDGRPFRFEILTMAGNDLRQDVLVMIQDQLARVGIEASQRAVEFNTLFSREASREFDCTFLAMGIPTNLDLSFFFHSRSIEEGYNFASYSEPELDQVLDDLQVEVDPGVARTLYDRVQEIIYRDQPVTFLYEPQSLVPIRRSLRHVDPNAISIYYNLEHWELAKDAENGDAEDGQP